MTDRSFLGASGEVARQAARVNWAATPLGPPAGWSAELRGMVQVLLTSRFSMWMAWGPQLTMFYNDAYRRDTLRTKHPWALGRPAREVWAEIWDEIGPRIESVLHTGEATWDEDLMLFLERSGYPEETYHTFSYSPLSEAGQVVGMLCVVTENTDRMLSERRMATLRDLGAAVAEARTESALLAAVEQQMVGNARDLPFALVYLFDEAGGRPQLAAASGVEAGSPVAAPAGDGWPVDRTRAGETVLVTDLRDRFNRLPTGAWAQPPTDAVVVPLTGAQGDARVQGFLVAGLSPVRPYDERYRAFVELLAGQIGSALVSAGAYEAERRRAEALAELDRAKTEFFSNVSHEFRTPLTLISGPVKDLLAASESGLGVDSGRMRAELSAVDRNAERLGRLVDNLLDFSRVQAGRAQANYEPTDLAAVTVDLASMFRAAVERAGLRFTVDVSDLGEPAWVDLSMWEKVVLNLLSNALKYTQHGSITVRLRRVDPTVVLEVIDTGTGIPAAELPRLFERFHRVPHARGRTVEGSGIGLALVRELVELHGGRVGARSELGSGTTLTVQIPLGSAHLPAEQVSDRQDGIAQYETSALAAAPYLADALGWLSPEEDGAGTPGAGTPSGAGARDGAAVAAGVAQRAAPADAAPATVLVVDDNADMSAYLTRLLAPLYRVRVAADGAAALDSALDEPPDAVITDVMMPRLDGFGLLAALRADARTATLPVIMLSARAGPAAAVDGLAAGADEYLVKPFTAAELLARVRSVLTLAKVRRREAAWRGALLDALQDGLFVVNEAGQVVEINDGFADIFGYGPEGLPYDVPHPWWPDPEADPDNHAQLTTVLTALQAAGRGRHVLALRHRDGHRLWVETSVDTIPDSDRTGAPMMIGVARDVTAAHRAAQRDRLLVDAGQVLAGVDEPDSSVAGRLHQLVGLAAAVFEDLVVVVRAGPDGRMSPVAAAHPQRPELAAPVMALAPVRLTADLAELYRHGRALVLDGPSPDTPGQEADAAASTPLTRPGTLVAPLVVGGRLLGLLLVGRPAGQPAEEFDRADIELAEELARRTALALEAERVATREHQLNTASAALAAAATVGEATAVLAEAVRSALDASGIAVSVPRADNPSRLELIHFEGLRREIAEGYADVSLGARIGMAEAARTGRPVWINDREIFRARFPDSPAGQEGSGVQAMAVLPLRLADHLAGVVSIVFATTREFPSVERKFITTLVGQAAQALARASLTDTRWDIAQTLQNALLPGVPPAIDRLAVATRYLPAVHDIAAGGDWYELIPLDEHRTAIVVGDVVGQGATAAAVMGQLRSALAFALTNQGSAADPAAALAQLNRFAFRVPDARGTTAVCVTVDLEAGRIRWACAGHLPPMLVRRTGEVRHLDEATGPLLGAFRDDGAGYEPYRNAVADLAPGDTVVLYTDGLIERRGESIDEGMNRLAEAAGEAAGDGPAALMSRLLAATLPDGRGHDDVAVVAARVLPAPLRQHRPADPRQLIGVRRAVAAWAAVAGLDAVLVEDLQLAVGEAAANAVEHAYPEGSGGEFDYELSCADDGLSTRVRVTVTDHGVWRPPPADRGYRGRGMEMIGSLATDVSVDHPAAGTGTTVRFTLVFPHPGAEQGPSPLRPDPGPVRSAEPGSLRVVEHPEDPDRRSLVLGGEIDLAAVDAIRAQVFAQLALRAPAALEIDLREVAYLSSAGVGLLLEIAERTGADGALPIILPRSGPVARVLALTGLRRLRMHPETAGSDPA